MDLAEKKIITNSVTDRGVTRGSMGAQFPGHQIAMGRRITADGAK